MIKAIHCNTQECQFVNMTDLDRISDMLPDTNHVFWLDLQNPTEQELAKVGEEFNLHPLALEDATSEHQRPKVEQYDDFFFIVFYTIGLNGVKDELQTEELNLFVGTNYVITVHYHAMPELEEARRRWERNQRPLELGVGSLLYAVLDTIVDGYFPLVDQLVDRAEVMEDQIYMGKSTTSNVQLTFRLLELKKMFLQFRRIIAPERDVMNVLTNRDNSVFNMRTIVYFRDVYDHITRLADTLDLYRDQLGSTMDANLSVSSNQLNKVMQTLTSASIILMSVTVIASIYGMNFDFMPELKWTIGYPLALGAMACVALILTMYFKRRKWF